jgi:hypothetical protein
MQLSCLALGRHGRFQTIASRTACDDDIRRTEPLVPNRATSTCATAPIVQVALLGAGEFRRVGKE